MTVCPLLQLLAFDGFVSAMPPGLGQQATLETSEELSQGMKQSKLQGLIWGTGLSSLKSLHLGLATRAPSPSTNIGMKESAA